MKKLLVIGFISWLAGLGSVLITSLIRFEIPGIPDIVGFSSYLLFGIVLLIPVCYLPMLRLIKKSRSAKLYLLSPWVFALIANMPCYFILWQFGERYFSSEAYLFTLGFFVIGFVFATGYCWHILRNKKWKITCLITALSVIVLYNLFDYQVLYQNAAHGTVHILKSMTTKRSAHTATLLNDGRILIAGGILNAEGAEVNNASAEIFDPKTGYFSLTGTMKHQRAGHTATLLRDGNVLITGGFNSGGFLSSAELYLPEAGTFIEVKGEMSEKRAAHTASLLNNGQVLILGGVNGSERSNQSGDIYDPIANNFKQAGKLQYPRTGHTSTLLSDGKVLITGGSSNWRSGVIADCELFDPSDNSFNATGKLNIPRNKHLAVLLPRSRVMIIGGSSTAADISGRYNSVEVYDPVTKQFTWLETSMIKPRFKITNAGDVLNDGTVVIGGDGKYVEVYDPLQNSFFTAEGNVAKAWMYPTVTTISDKKVLITGGYDANMKTTNGAWLYETARTKDIGMSTRGLTGYTAR